MFTVDDLVSQIRSQLDEDNVDTLDTDTDILPALNRAQSYAANILARHYEDPLLTYTTVDLVSGQQEYNIPEDAFEDRVEKLELTIGQTQNEIQRISYRDISAYETQVTTAIPRYYVIIGKKIRLVPTPSGAYDVRVWYLKTPPSLQSCQGRITKVNTADNYIIVDQVGSNVTTEMDQLGSYVNLVDGQTGLIKGSLQVKTVSANKISFKTVPSRATVQNKTIVAALTSLGVEPDDYVSPIQGTCVPSLLGDPVNNFLIQYAVAELSRKLGGASGLEEGVLAKFEQHVERSWVGREQTKRVKKRSKQWDRSYRRWVNG